MTAITPLCNRGQPTKRIADLPMSLHPFMAGARNKSLERRFLKKAIRTPGTPAATEHCSHANEGTFIQYLQLVLLLIVVIINFSQVVKLCETQ